MNVDNIDKLSNEDLSKIIKKYNINTNGITLNRSNAITLVKNFIIQKQMKNVKNISVNNQKNRQRRMSSANSTSVKRENIPQNDVKHVRDRRMSQPQTKSEIRVAKRDHELKSYQNLETQKAIKSLNDKMPQYDNVGMYPKQKRLVAIGDVHGDLIIQIYHLIIHNQIYLLSININHNHLTF